MTKVSCC